VTIDGRRVSFNVGLGGVAGWLTNRDGGSLHVSIWPATPLSWGEIAGPVPRIGPIGPASSGASGLPGPRSEPAGNPSRIDSIRRERPDENPSATGGRRD
jgi:hypothetical protein